MISTSEETNADLVSVCEPPDEMAAQMVKGLLQTAGIDVVLRSWQIPWYDDIATLTMNEGKWGQVLVRQTDEVKARLLVTDYLAKVESGEAARELFAEEGVEEGSIF